MQETLRPIREKREELGKNPDYVMQILREGTIMARETAAQTVKRVKSAMKLNYFD
jgi:tryptophanyl-tRNA synthetase